MLPPNRIQFALRGNGPTAWTMSRQTSRATLVRSCSRKASQSPPARYAPAPGVVSGAAGEELHQPVALAFRESACNAGGGPGRKHRLAGHRVLVLPGRVQAGTAQDQHLPPAGYHGYRILLQPGCARQVGNVLRIGRRAFRRIRAHPMHAGQHCLVIRRQDAAPVFHNRAVTSG